MYTMHACIYMSMCVKVKQYAIRTRMKPGRQTSKPAGKSAREKGPDTTNMSNVQAWRVKIRSDVQRERRGDRL